MNKSGSKHRSSKRSQLARYARLAVKMARRWRREAERLGEVVTREMRIAWRRDWFDRFVEYGVQKLCKMQVIPTSLLCPF